MAGTINIYEAYADDFECEGLGTLMPLDWTFNNKGIGGAILTIKHPYDDAGKWTMIQGGRVVKCDVPVRQVPEIAAGARVETAEKWSVLGSATKAQRYLYSKASGGKKKKLVPAGAELTVLAKGTERYKATYYGTKKKGKKTVKTSWTGWIATQAMNVKIEDLDVSTNAKLETSVPSVETRAQLFRLMNPKMGEKEITCEAMPIAYDAAGILTDPYITTALTGPQLMERIIERAYMDTDVELYTDIGDSRTGFDKRNVSIIAALLDGEDSFVGRYGGDVVIDDNTITILRSAGVDRGFYATYGRNLTGVDSYEVDDDITTAILPVGELENGDPLYLATDPPYVLSTNADQFPVPHMAELKVSEAKVNKKNGMTVALARQKLQEAVAAEWEKGVHIPSITLKVTFAMLGDSEEYADFRAIDQCHMYDIVHVWHPKVCGYVAMAVCETEWNGMQERYTSVTLGTPGGTLSSAKISAGQISGSINGRQIAWNTLSSGQLANDIIAARHIQTGSINAEAMQTESFTAETAFVQAMNASALTAVTAHIQALTAGTITTDELYASIAHMLSLTADNINAGSISTDELAAQLAEISVLCAGTATFDRATVQHLVAEAMNLSYGVGEEVFIDNLAVRYAQIVSATIADLVLLASDGNYYQLDVDADGLVTTTQVYPTEEEIAQGGTSDGHPILATSITAERMNTSDLLATYALINVIDAARIDVDQLFARQAFIDELNTALIQSDSALNIVVGNLKIGSRNYLRNSKSLTDAAASDAPAAIAPIAGQAVAGQAVAGSSWSAGSPSISHPDEIVVYDGTPQNVLQITDGLNGAVKVTCLPYNEDAPAMVSVWAKAESETQARFRALGAYFNETIGTDWQRIVLPVEEPSGCDIEIMPMDNTTLWLYQMMVEANATKASDWSIAPEDVSEPLAKLDSDFRRVVRVDPEGLHVGDNQTRNEVLIDSDSVNVRVGGVTGGRFAANFVQLGNYRMYISNDGGMAFKVVESYGNNGQ